MKLHESIARCLFAVLGFALIAPAAHAQFTNNSQTITINAVTSNWVGNGTYVVGSNTFLDTLIIQSAGVLSNGTGYIGYETSASNNTAIVRDPGSVWTNRFDLHVGVRGAGNQLVISNGAAVYSADAVVGEFPSASNNTAIVSGSNSVWNIVNELIISSNAANNTLIITNGGQVVDEGALIGTDVGASLNASVLVTGTNSFWDNATNALISTGYGFGVTVDNGGRFAAGGTVQIGRSAGASGNIVLVTDPGSTWSNGTLLQISGFSGWNQFIVSNGATAYSGSATIGPNLSTLSNGVVVTGPGSAWTVGGGITVADSGRASFLTVTNGGLVRAQDEFVGNQAGSSGSLIVAGGTNEVFNSLQLGQFGGTGTVDIASGALFVTNATANALAVVNANCTLILGAGLFKSDNLVVTNGGVVQYNLNYQVDNGTVTVSGGSLQAGSNLFIAASADSTSTVLVVGGTLVATNGTVSVGNNGTVTSGGGVGRTIISGGTLLFSRITVGNSAGAQCDLILTNGAVISDGGCPSGNCRITINSLGFGDIGSTVDACNTPMSVGVTAPSDYAVSGNASDSFQDLYVGDTDVGTLTMAAGVLNVCQQFIVGNQGPPFEVTPSVGAVWINGGQLTITNPSIYSIIGNSGMGQMTISNGTVIMATVVVGNNNSNPGMLTVAGAAMPVMTVLSSLIVGDCGLGNVGMVTVAGGNLFVTNAAHNATLDVRDGTFIVSSGLVMVDKLVVTSACARVVHTGGGLIYSQLVLDPNQSTVNDGIPNGWKQQYGLDPFDPNVGNEGADGTGMNNLQKYLAGFAPNNSAAYPHIISLARQGANMNVAYRGANGDSTYLPGIASRTNVLEFTAGTGGGNFPNSPLYTGIQTNILSGGTGLGVVTNTIDSGGATNTPSRFYRVRVLVP